MMFPEKGLGGTFLLVGIGLPGFPCQERRFAGRT